MLEILDPVVAEALHRSIRSSGLSGEALPVSTHVQSSR